MSFISGPKIPKSGAPDYKAIWQQYKGEFDNINKRTEGGIADIRARFAATGASPDLLDAEANRLRETGRLDIAALRQSTTYAALEEGFAIATGRAGNPYSDALAGVEDFGVKQRQRDPTPEEKAQFHSTDSNAQEPRYYDQYRLKEPPKTLEEYFQQYYPTAPSSAAETPEEKVRRAATGYGGGDSGGTTPNPLLPSFKNPNDVWS